MHRPLFFLCTPGIVSELGDLVYRTTDADGEIHVYEDRRFRYLTFGNAVEQSCFDPVNPAQLQHVYTQAMMLALLLHPEPRDVVLLGLGGGSLARAMRAADRRLRILGVERRAAVIDVAKRYFDLPKGARFGVICAEADVFLEGDSGGRDLILADLYLAEGMHPRQLATDFLALCRARLSESGVLVVNQWASEYQRNRQALGALHEVFEGRLIQLHVQGGNILTFGFNGGLPTLRRDDFFADAQALGLRLGVPLQRQARNLWRQNAEVLGVGRFRGHRVL